MAPLRLARGPYSLTPRNFSFDFYLPDRDALVEFHGIQHYEPVEIFGGKQGFKLTQQRDRFKARWARENGFNLITIKYTENVERVLSAALGTLAQAA